MPDLCFCRRMSSPSNGSLNCATTGRLWNRNLGGESVGISIWQLYWKLYMCMTVMIQAIENFAVLEHSQVDDRSAENLWVRMVQTPFPYGGRLSSSVNTTPVRNYLVYFLVTNPSDCSRFQMVRLRIPWKFLPLGHYAPHRYVPWSNLHLVTTFHILCPFFMDNLWTLKVTTCKMLSMAAWNKKIHTHTLTCWTGATWLWWEHKAWILEVLLQDQQAMVFDRSKLLGLRVFSNCRQRWSLLLEHRGDLCLIEEDFMIGIAFSPHHQISLWMTSNCFQLHTQRSSVEMIAILAILICSLNNMQVQARQKPRKT